MLVLAAAASLLRKRCAPLGTLERASKLKTVHEIWLAKVTSGWNSL